MSFKFTFIITTGIMLISSSIPALSINIKEKTQVKDFQGGVLNVRYGPGQRKISTIKSGTPVRVLKVAKRGRNHWSRIQWNGKIGWVSSKYLEKVALTDTSKTYQVNASALNVRNSAGRNNKVLRTLPRGTSGIKILGLKKVGRNYWANISQDDKKGWVSSQYLKEANDLKVADAKEPTAVKKQYYTVKPGDTLYAIQRKTGKKWQHIASANKIDSPYRLSVGRNLLLP